MGSVTAVAPQIHELAERATEVFGAGRKTVALAFGELLRLVRRSVFEKRPLPRGGWVSGNYPIIRDAADVGARGHILALDWQPKLAAVIFRISLYTQESTYGVRLSYGAFNLSPPIEGRAHFYNLATKKVESATRVEHGIALL